MTSWIIRALFAPFVLAPAFAAEPPIVVGAVVSQSGMLADLADGYRKGLLVWQDEVNAAGGVRGRNVELRLLDDGSEAARNSALYQRSEERRVGKSVDLGGRRIIKKKKIK